MALSPKRVLVKRLRKLWRQVRVLVQLLRDPRTPGVAKAAALAVLVYVVSPLDVVPDPLLFGLIDDLVVVPLGMGAVKRLAGREAVVEAEERVDADPEGGDRWKRVAVAVIVLWVLSLVLLVGAAWWFWGR